LIEGSHRLWVPASQSEQPFLLRFPPPICKMHCCFYWFFLPSCVLDTELALTIFSFFLPLVCPFCLESVLSIAMHLWVCLSSNPLSVPLTNVLKIAFPFAVPAGPRDMKKMLVARHFFFRILFPSVCGLADSPDFLKSMAAKSFLRVPGGSFVWFFERSSFCCNRG